MTINCMLRLLLAKVNVERARQGKSALSLRQLANESGVSLSVLSALNTGRSSRIDYHTIDQLGVFQPLFFCYHQRLTGMAAKARCGRTLQRCELKKEQMRELYNGIHKV